MLYDEHFLGRLQDGVRQALPRWGVSPGADLRLLTISENATFRAAHTGLDGDVVFRVHRPGYHTRAEIASEIAWVEALRRDGVVATPRPVPLSDGTLIADLDDGGMLRHVVAFEFAPGKEPDEGENLVAWFRELGSIHARLHGHSRGWRRPKGFVRKVWNFESMLGGAPLWGDFRAGLGLTPEGRATLERAAALLKERLAPLETPENFGLIHADLRLANLLVDRDRLTLIDFDDCGFSWFLYDFAAAVSFIEHEHYVPDLRAAWVEGYRAHLPLSDGEERQLDLFVMLRRILLTAWVASHAETPTAKSMGIPYTEGTVAMAEDFLARHG